jgi:hypothetical protein
MRKNIYILLCCAIFSAAFVVSCSKDPSTASDVGSNTGTGGSTARFSIVGNFLYTIDDKNLKVFRISEPENPVFLSNIKLGLGIETIFSLNDKLLIGAADGMYIYSIAQPQAPQLLTKYEHIRRCDPVVANDSIAFVTLRTQGGGCRAVAGQTNVLELVDIRNISNPTLIRSVAMKNPYGVGLDENLLFVCDAGALRVMDVAEPFGNIPQISSLAINVNDVIPLGGHLLAVGDAAVYDIDYTDPTNLRIVAQIKRSQNNLINTPNISEGGQPLVHRSN